MTRDRITRLHRLKASELAPHPGNPRRHPEAQRNVVAGSLATLGQVAPLLAYREADGTLRLFDGHLRASLDPEAEITVAETDLSPAEARQALALLDPSAAMAETDAALMADLLEAVRADTAAGLLAADERLDGLLTDLTRPPLLTDPDELPPAATVPARARRGQVWGCGAHRVMCGDATCAEDVARLMGGERAALLHLDPPYGISIVAPKEGAAAADSGGSKPWGSTSGVNRKSSSGFDAARLGSALNGPKSRNQIIQSNLYPVMQGDDEPFDPTALLDLAPVVILWGANYYADRLPTRSSWLCWDKRENITRNSFADCELAWCSKGGPARVFHHLWNGLHKGSQHGEKRTHPTEKPVALFAEIGQMFAPGGLWLDLYGGTGAQVIAAEQVGARARMMEIEPQYADIALTRWERATGGAAVLEQP